MLLDMTFRLLPDLRGILLALLDVIALHWPFNSALSYVPALFFGVFAYGFELFHGVSSFGGIYQCLALNASVWARTLGEQWENAP